MAKKTTPKKSGPTPAQRKTRMANKLGYGDQADPVAAMKAATRQYGLVGGGPGQFKRPDATFVERQMVANGWGMGQTADTPVNIGGMRVYTGPSGLTFTGERSDAAKRNPGGAYNAGKGSQTAYKAAGLNAKGGGAKGKAKGKPTSGGSTPKTDVPDSGFAAGADSTYTDKPYAEADTTTTGMTRAQGKAYAASRGSMAGSLQGQTGSPTEDSAVVGEGQGAAGGGKGKGKTKTRKTNKRGNTVVRTRKNGKVVSKRTIKKK